MSKKRAVVLAAGKGTRMKSELPKVLIPVAGRPMIDYVLDTLEAAGFDEILVVIGYRSDLVRQTLADRKHVTFVEQTEQLGTGHAVMVCREHLGGEGPVLVVTGDSPMLQADSVRQLLADFERTQPACLLGTAIKDEPFGLGRIVRDADGNFQAIVEQRDATPEQQAIREVNLSTYLFQASELVATLGKLSTNNQQREYYLTDCPGLLKAAGKDVRALPILKPVEALSINTPDELKIVEAAMAG